MAQLADCPDELLLNIAANLRSRDLKALALTARKYRGAAQEALHTHLELKSLQTPLPRLLRTLIERPDLALKIQTVAITAHAQVIEETETLDNIVDHARGLAKHWKVEMADWIDRLENGCELANIGLLLALASRLKQLSIAPVADDSDWRFINLPYMFAKRGRKSLVASIPILTELNSLSIPLNQLDQYWCSLPQLQRLNVDCTRDIWNPRLPGSITGVHSLSMRCTTRLEGRTTGREDVASFAGKFGALRSLHIAFTNWKKADPDYDTVDDPFADDYNEQADEIIRHRYDANFSDITAKLGPVAHLITEFKLSCVDIGDRKDLSYLRPLSSLHNFTQLKRLSIPQGAFIYTTGLDPPSPYALYALPPNLEYMCVYDPTPAVVNWLSGILDDRDKLRNLKTVLLDFESNQRNKVSDYREAACETGRRLCEAGVDVRYENAHPNCREL
jgi:hypothetical protein